MPYLPISNILANSNSLQDILQKAQELSKLNDTIKSIVEPSYAQYFQVANLRDGILVLITSRPEWGHTLRFSINDILNTLKKYPIGRAIQSIHIKVIPET